MKNVIVFFAVLWSLSAALAADKTILQTQSLNQFRHAVELLDSYSGDSSVLEAARADLDKVLKANPSYAPAHREMARYFIKSGYIRSSMFRPGSLDAADSSIKKAIEIDKNYADAFVLRGHLYRLMGLRKEAYEALNTAEMLGSNDPWLHNNWADLLLDEGKIKLAVERYMKVVDSKTSDKNAMASAFGGLIRYYDLLGKLDRMDELQRKRIETDPGVAWYHGDYAKFLLCKRDDYENSIARSRQALSIMNYGVGRYWLAAALYRKWAQRVVVGKAAEGRQYFLEARSIYPDVDDLIDEEMRCPPLAEVRKTIVYSNEAVPKGGRR